MKTKPHHLHFILIIIIALSSCATSSNIWKDYTQEDIEFFEFSPKDTVLDFNGSNLFLDNYLFTKQSDLFFYVPCKQNEKEATKNIIDKYDKKYFKNDFKKSINLVTRIEDSVLLKPNSVDRILLTKLNLNYTTIDNILVECKRLLKPNGVIIASISTLQSFNPKKYSDEATVISYFENKGFRSLKTKTYKKEKGSYIILMLGKSSVHS